MCLAQYLYFCSPWKRFICISFPRNARGIMTESEFNRVRADLLESIAELFHKYGLRSTSMDDICTHLKISKKTLYQYFNSKDDLVEQLALHRENILRVENEVKEMQKLDSVEFLLVMGENIIQHMNSQHQTNLFDLKKYHPEVYQRISHRHQVFFYEQLTQVLERGIRDGYFRKDIDKQVQIYLFAKQIGFLGEPEVMSNMKYPIDVIISTIIENTIRSFVTPAGMEKLENLLKNRKEKGDGTDFVVPQTSQKRKVTNKITRE